MTVAYLMVKENSSNHTAGIFTRVVSLGRDGESDCDGEKMAAQSPANGSVCTQPVNRIGGESKLTFATVHSRRGVVLHTNACTYLYLYKKNTVLCDVCCCL